MTQDDEPQGNNVLIPRPISVHALSEDNYRRRFRHVITPTASLTGIAVTGVCVYFAVTAKALWWIAPAIILGIAVPVGVVNTWRSYRHGLKLCQSSAVELWPDGITYRIAGRPPLVIRREDMVSLKFKPGRNGRLYVGNRDASRSVAIANDVNDFDALHRALSEWCPENRSAANPFLRLRRLSYALAAVNIACFLVVLWVRNVWIVTPAAIVVLGLDIRSFVAIHRAEYLDKASRRRRWILVASCLLVLALATVKWLSHYGVPWWRAFGLRTP